MRRAFHFGALVLLSACSPRGEEPKTEGESPEPIQTRTPLGLYQGTGQAEASRLCINGSQESGWRFAMVLRDPQGLSCGGAGTAEILPTGLRLEMAGDESCEIDARLNGLDLSFGHELADGCAYYCGEGASLAGAVFRKTGGTEADALEARDPVGDPLCSDLSDG